MIIRKIGDWIRARRILRAAPSAIKPALQRAFLQEAQNLQGMIRQGISAQAPGGKKFKPLSPLTIVRRGMRRASGGRRVGGRAGTNILQVRGDLWRSIIAKKVGDLQAFVGVLRAARSREGKPLMEIASVHEFGAGPIVIPITPAMRKFLAMLFQLAGRPRASGGKGKGIVVITIPPRPFLEPTYKQWEKQVKSRMLRRIAKALPEFGG